MKTHRLLLLCFLSVSSPGLCDGDTGFISANTFIRPEGGSVMAACPFTLSGRRKFLCRDACEAGDTLIQTEGSAAQSGRYTIRYEEGTFPLSSTYLYVSVTRLNKSDSGRYRCGLERALLPDSYWEFEIQVSDAPQVFPQAVNQPKEEATAAATVKVSPPGYMLPLLLCVTVLFAAAAAVLSFLWRTRSVSDGVTSRGQSADTDWEVSICCSSPKSVQTGHTWSPESVQTGHTCPPAAAAAPPVYCNL